MTTQNSKNQVAKKHCPEVKADKLVSNPLLANLIGQFKPVIEHTSKNIFPYPFSIFEGVKVLSKVSGSWTEAGDHDRAGVAPQRVLEQPRNLGLPIGHVSATPPGVTQGADNIAHG